MKLNAALLKRGPDRQLSTCSEAFLKLVTAPGWAPIYFGYLGYLKMAGILSAPNLNAATTSTGPLRMAALAAGSEEVADAMMARRSHPLNGTA